MITRKRNAIFGGLAVCAWLAVIAIGSVILVRYELTPGVSGESVQQLPAEGNITSCRERPSLVMFAHPRCPCTQASIEELAKIIAQSSRSINSYLVFFRPDRAPESWSQTALWRAAERVPGLQLLIDGDGRLAKKFGARTSGHVFLYDEFGDLLYQGGITASRGHAGDSYGKAAILSLLKGNIPNQTSSLVFGCPLQEPTPTTNTDCAACPTM